MTRMTLALVASVVVTMGCRSSEENAGAAGAMPAAPETGKADDGRGEARDPYEGKVVGEVNRAEARRDAAEERNRRIDVEPVVQPPEPRAEEKPPR